MSTYPPFKYSKLESDEIRLLTPKFKDSGVIEWKLESVPLESKVDGKGTIASEYDALSYTWGSPEDQTFAVICNDETLMVRKNLYEALPCLARHLNRPGIVSRPRRIWIDAVCIDQSNEDEKKTQINLMADIYRLAEEVIVWLGLGRGKDYNDAAIALLPSLDQIGKIAFRSLMDNRQPEPTFFLTEMPEASSPIWDVVSDIVFHDWYTRLWVMQELALAKSAVALVGDSTLDFDSIENAAEFLMAVVTGKVSHLGPGVQTLQREANKRNIDTRRLLHQKAFLVMRGVLIETPDTTPQYVLPLLDSSGARIIPAFREFDDDPLVTAVRLTTMSQQCTEPRDRVFGVLGFSQLNARIKSPPDFTQIDGLAELYTAFMSHVFVRGGRVRKDPTHRILWELFSYGCLPKQTPGLPSWCPDLRVQRGPSTPNGLSQVQVSYMDENGSLGYSVDKFCYTASPEASKIAKGRSDRELVIKGRVLDRLHRVYQAFPELDLTPSQKLTHFSNMHSTIGEWEKEVAAQVRGPHGVGAKGTVSLDTYWRTLVGNQTSLSEGNEEFTEETIHALRDFHSRTSKMNSKFDAMEKRYGSYDAIFSEGGYKFTEEDKETMALGRRSQVMSFSRQLGNAQVGRQLFSTADGHFGCGNVGLHEDDVVCVFSGALTPHVLRKVSDSDGVTHYRLVAEAYVHGMMNGEVQDLGLEAEDIHLI